MVFSPNPSRVSRREFIGVLGGLALPALLHGSEPGAEEVNLLALGDWGAPPKTGDPKDAARLRTTQDRVAAAMIDYATKLSAIGPRLDAVMALGDNFYGELKDEHDLRFQERFEDLYTKPALDVPFLFALGNHDYEDGDRDGWKRQIAYAKKVTESTPPGRWRFPAAGDATWYRQDFPSQSPFVSILVLDTNTDHVGNRWEKQMDWLEEQLESTKDSRWRIVVAHHPMFTDGYHWDGKKDPSLYPKIRETILSKLERTVFYVSGHDHNQQHIRHPDYPKLDFLVSGAGGGDFIQKRKRLHPPYQNEFIDAFGFLHLRFTAKEATAQFIAMKGDGWESRHTVTRS